MILKHVHLFGLLLLSLIFASFLGKFLDIGGGSEGLENEGDAAVTNQHTGGSMDHITTNGMPSVPDDGGSDPPVSHPMPSDPRGGGGGGGGEGEGFGNAFDSILPAGVGSSMEPFISPVSGREGLANSQGPETGGMGIPKSQIPPGQDHLYVLKSQVVPPTSCPVCPTNSGGGGGGGGNLEDSSSGLSNGLGSAFSANGGGGVGGANGSSKCPPCPACARCPEPSFDCKKVPNYSIGQNGSMSVPRPVLADFSQFGM